MHWLLSHYSPCELYVIQLFSRAAGFSCNSIQNEDECDNDPKCEQSGQICLAEADACTVASDTARIKVLALDGQSRLTPETTVFDILFEDDRVPISDISLVRIDCPICYQEEVPVTYEFLPNVDNPEKIRVYGGVTVALATPGYPFALKLERKSCSQPIVRPLVTEHTEFPPVTWFSDETTPQAQWSLRSINWQERKGFCEVNGMRLCTYEEVCPYGKDRAVAGDPFGATYIADPPIADWTPFFGEEQFLREITGKKVSCSFVVKRGLCLIHN